MSEVLAVAEIGGTSVKIGFAVDGRPAEVSRTFPTQALRTSDPAGRLAALLGEASAEAGLVPRRLVATVPGFLDRDFDRVLHAANVPELNGHRFASELSAALDMPVRLERDVVLQLLGEAKAGAVEGACDVLGVYLGTGIGAAYLGRDGIFRGGGWALEIGHMPMRPRRAGETPKSIEAYASGGALVALAAEHGVDVRDIFRPMTNAALSEAVESVVEDQAIAIASAVTLLSPCIVLVGGGVAEMTGYPKDRLAASIARCLPLAGTVQPLDVTFARLGWQAAIWGALSLTEIARP